MANIKTSPRGWNDARLEWISEDEGRSYRPPTEDEIREHRERCRLYAEHLAAQGIVVWDTADELADRL